MADTKLSYDGVRYVALARGEAVPRPFALRWLVPTLIGVSADRWRAVQLVSLAALGALGWCWCGSWLGAALPLGLAAITWFNLRFVVLVDLPAMACALGCAVAVRAGGPWIVLGVALALAAGATKEPAPVFAALWCWSPWPLLGLLAPLAALGRRHGPDPVAALQVAPESRGGRDDAVAALSRPLATAWKAHRDLWQHPEVLLAPWGVLLVGVAGLDWRGWVVVGAAYAQLAVATDCARLYVWCWPTLAYATTSTIPARWWVLAAVVHLANPARGSGV